MRAAYHRSHWSAGEPLPAPGTRPFAVNGFNRFTAVTENAVSLEAYPFDTVGNTWPAAGTGASLPQRLQPGANPFHANNRVGY